MAQGSLIMLTNFASLTTFSTSVPSHPLHASPAFFLFPPFCLTCLLYPLTTILLSFLSFEQKFEPVKNYFCTFYNPITIISSKRSLNINLTKRRIKMVNFVISYEEWVYLRFKQNMTCMSNVNAT